MLITSKALQTVASRYVKNSLEPGFSSLDVRASGRTRKESRSWVDTAHDKSFRDIEYKEGTFIHLLPGEFILINTKEIFTMPHNVMGMFTLRSKWARKGLDQSASLVLQPNWEGNLVMEVRNNLQRHTLSIPVGEAIGQVHFFRCMS